MMNVHLFEYICGKCGTHFKEPGLCSASGRLILRGEGSGVPVAVDSWDDAVFEEVRQMVDQLAPQDVGVAKRGELVQRAFSVACDPDESGLPYSIDAMPRCPVCASNRIDEWRATEPPEFVEDRLPAVTHVDWLHLDEHERRRRVGEAIGDALSG